MRLLLAFALGAIIHPAIRLPDIDGIERTPLKVSPGTTQVLFFVTHDCPISNYYSHEIRRICDQYASRHTICALVYVDPTISDADARRHATEYGHGSYEKIVDRKHELVAATGATITPEAVVIRSDETMAYRGRIDNAYAGVGRPRTVVNEHDLRDALDAVLSGKPVPKPETDPVGCYIPPMSVFSRR